MGLILIALALIVIGGIFFAITKYTYCDMEIRAFACTCIGAMALLFFIPMTVMRNNNFAKIELDYYALNDLIEYSRNSDVSEFERVKIYESIHETNKMINSHKVYCNSKWVGIWHSEKIANLEYLK